MVIVVNKRWSLTRVSDYDHLTGETFVFWKSGHIGKEVVYKKWLQTKGDLTVFILLLPDDQVFVS